MMMHDLKLPSASISSATYRLHRLITVNLKINNKMLLFFCPDEGLVLEAQLWLMHCPQI